MDPDLKDWSTDENNMEIPGEIKLEAGEGGRDPGIPPPPGYRSWEQMVMGGEDADKWE